MMNQQEKDKICAANDALEQNEIDRQGPDEDANSQALQGEPTPPEHAGETGQDIESELAAAQQEVVKLKDAYLRAKAEQDNVRRRSEKEVASSRKFAVEGFAKEILEVRDSLTLACSVALPEDADDAVKSIDEGVKITLKQLDAALAKFSVTEIKPTTGDKLDPNLHQAMSIVESDDADAGCIITVIQSGFQMHDRLLRPAMVVVAK